MPAYVVVDVDNPCRPVESAATARHHGLCLTLGVQPDEKRIGHTPADPIEHGMMSIGAMKPVTPGWHSRIPILSTGVHRVGKRFPASIDPDQPSLFVPYSF